jgi:spore coat polysaccharide biosynthesis protein SpsF
VLERLSLAQTVKQTVVATTTDPSDQAIVDFCRQGRYPFARGHMHDVLDRFCQAAKMANAEIIVRITADCPLIDPALVDETVRAFCGLDAAPGPFDFAANRLPPPFRRTYPIGLDAEVCSFAALERAWREADRPFHREHVMPYFYEGVGAPERVVKLNSPGYLEVFHSPRGFRVLLLNNDHDYGDFRWTVDTAEDLEVLELIVQRLKARRPESYRDFTWHEVLALALGDPALRSRNAGVYHKDFRESEQAT